MKTRLQSLILLLSTLMVLVSSARLLAQQSTILHNSGTGSYNTFSGLLIDFDANTGSLVSWSPLLTNGNTYAVDSVSIWSSSISVNENSTPLYLGVYSGWEEGSFDISGFQGVSTNTVDFSSVGQGAKVTWGFASIGLTADDVVGEGIGTRLFILQPGTNALSVMPTFSPSIRANSLNSDITDTLNAVVDGGFVGVRFNRNPNYEAVVTRIPNNLPVFTADPVNKPGANENSPYNETLAGSATDSDGDDINYSKEGGPAWLTVEDDGALSGTPGITDGGVTNVFTISATDTKGGQSLATLNIFVTNVNTAPVWSADPSFVNEDYSDMTGTSIAGYVSDPDIGDVLTFAKLSGGPAWLSVAGNGALSGAPTAPTDDGLNSWDVTVTDLDGLSATNTLTIWAGPALATITNTANNQSWLNAIWGSPAAAPQAGYDYVAVNAGSSPRIRTSTEGTSGGEDSNNFPGNSLTIEGSAQLLVKTDFGNTASIGGGSGDLILDGGNILHGPNGAGNGDATLDVGSFEVTANGGSIDLTTSGQRLFIAGTLTGTGDLAISDTENNDTNRFVSIDALSGYTGDISVSEEVGLDFNSDTVLVGDLDLGVGAWLHVDQNISIDNRKLSDPVNGFVPAGVYSGASLTALGPNYRDGGGTLTVNFVANFPPEFTSDPISLNAKPNLAISGTLADFAQDDNGDLMTFSKLTADPTWLTVAPDGTLGGTPNATHLGVNTCTVQVRDDFGGTNTATLRVNVAPGDIYEAEDALLEFGTVASSANPGYTGTGYADYAGAFSAVEYFIETPSSATYSIDMRYALSGADRPVRVLVNSVSNATWQCPETGGFSTWAYTPKIDVALAAGFHSVRVESIDAGPNADHLRVSGPPTGNSPTFLSNPVVVAGGTQGAPYAGTLAGSATDPDGDAVGYQKVNGPTWLSIAADGTLNGTPSNEDVGANSWTIQALDGNGNSDTATLNLFVTNVNDAPVWNSSPTFANTGYADMTGKSLAGYASDPDAGDVLAFAKLAGGPAWLNVAGNGALSGAPTAPTDDGLNTWDVAVTDLDGLSATNTLSIWVGPALATITNTVNNQSWLNAIWGSPAAAPEIGNDYVAVNAGADQRIRTTPAGSSGSYDSNDFPGNSLTISSTAQLLVKTSDGNTASILGGEGTLILDGGNIKHGPNGGSGEMTLDVGEVHVTSTPGARIDLTTTGLILHFAGTLTGTGDLLISDTENDDPDRYVSFDAVGNYTGDITVSEEVGLDFDSDTTLVGVLTLVGTNAYLNVDQTINIGSGNLLANSVVIPDGSYSGASLDALGVNFRNGGGTLNVGVAVPVPQPVAIASSFSGGQFTITYSNLSTSVTYTLERGTNVTSYPDNVDTHTPGSPIDLFIDSAPPASGAFYRLSTP